MRARRCVAERVRNPQTMLPDSPEVWHIVDGEADADFAPILCGRQTGEGITLPGYPETREPDCPECITLATSPAGRG